jgi:hypothetical protein
VMASASVGPVWAIPILSIAVPPLCARSKLPVASRVCGQLSSDVCTADSGRAISCLTGSTGNAKGMTPLIGTETWRERSLADGGRPESGELLKFLVSSAVVVS